MLWSIGFVCIATETPQQNPRISEKEKKYICNRIGDQEVGRLSRG